MGSVSNAPAFQNIPPGLSDPMNDLKIRIVSDKSPDKIVLGAGVYRDEKGRYYELPTIRKAKQVIASQPADHDYGFTTGDPEFLAIAQKIIFGSDSEALQSGRVASIQTIAGSGAVHAGALFAQRFFTSPSSPPTVYIGVPAWGTYETLFPHAGLPVKTYDYYDAAAKAVAYPTILRTIRDAPRGSVFVLQACCHNPTGLDLSKEQWGEVADLLAAGGHLPFFDIAYQGFGAGLDADAWAVRAFAARGLDILVAQSFSKNMGLYGERVGALHVVTRGGPAVDVANVTDQLRALMRREYSTPPRWPAALVRIAAGEFWDEWLEDVRNMRERVQQNRRNLHKLLTEELKTPGDWDNIIKESGLFSLLDLTEAQVYRIASEHHIHFPTNGRINVAGLNDANVGRVARAIDQVVRS